MNIFGHARHHLSKKVEKEIAIGISLCFFALGIGLAYAVYETDKGLNDAVWIQTSSNITYTYTMRARGGRTTASFSPIFLVSASYTYTSSDRVTYQGHDYTTTGQVPLSMQPTTEAGTVYYDQKDPSVSHVFPIGSETDYVAWVLVIMLLLIGALPFITSLES